MDKQWEYKDSRTASWHHVTENWLFCLMYEEEVTTRNWLKEMVFGGLKEQCWIWSDQIFKWIMRIHAKNGLGLWYRVYLEADRKAHVEGYKKLSYEMRNERVSLITFLNQVLIPFQLPAFSYRNYIILKKGVNVSFMFWFPFLIFCLYGLYYCSIS